MEDEGKCDPAANVKQEEPIDSPRKKASEIQQMEGVNKYYTWGRLESMEVNEEWEHRSGKMLQKERRNHGCKYQWSTSSPLATGQEFKAYIHENGYMPHIYGVLRKRSQNHNLILSLMCVCDHRDNGLGGGCATL